MDNSDKFSTDKEKTAYLLGRQDMILEQIEKTFKEIGELEKHKLFRERKTQHVDGGTD